MNLKQKGLQLISFNKFDRSTQRDIQLKQEMFVKHLCPLQPPVYITSSLHRNEIDL